MYKIASLQAHIPIIGECLEANTKNKQNRRMFFVFMSNLAEVNTSQPKFVKYY